MTAAQHKKNKTIASINLLWNSRRKELSFVHFVLNSTSTFRALSLLPRTSTLSLFLLKNTETLSDLLNIFIAQRAECLKRLLFYNPYTIVPSNEFGPTSLHSQRRCWHAALWKRLLVISLLRSLQRWQFEGQIHWRGECCKRISESQRRAPGLRKCDGGGKKKVTRWRTRYIWWKIKDLIKRNSAESAGLDSRRIWEGRLFVSWLRCGISNLAESSFPSCCVLVFFSANITVSAHKVQHH